MARRTVTGKEVVASVNAGNRRSQRNVNLKPKIPIKISDLQNNESNSTIPTTSGKSKKDSAIIEEPVKLLNNNTVKQGRKPKVSKECEGLNFKKTLTNLNGTKTKSRKRVKLPKIIKNTIIPVNLGVTEQIQELESIPSGLTQQAVALLKKKKITLNNIKLKAAVDKTEVLNNNGEWSTFNNDSINIPCKIEEKDDINLNNFAFKEEPQIEQVTKMAYNIKEKHKKQKKPTKITTHKLFGDTESEDDTNKSNGIKEQIMPPNFKEWKKIIRDGNRISKKRLKKESVINTKKIKLSKNILEKRKKKAIRLNISSSSSSNSSSTGSSQEDTIFSKNCINKDEDCENLEKRPHSDHHSKNKTLFRRRIIDETTEFTQDEDSLNDEKLPRKKRKVCHNSKFVDKNYVGLEKNKELSTKTCSDVVKKHYESPERSFENTKSNNVCEPVVITDNILLVADNTEDDITSLRNQSSNIDETIDYVVRQCNELINEEKTKKMNDVLMQNVMKSINSKTLVVSLENILLNKNYVKDYKLTKQFLKKDKPKNKTDCSKVDEEILSQSLNKLSPKTETNVLGKNTAPATDEIVNKNNNNNFRSFMNIRITRTLGTDTATISCVPVLNKDEDKLCEKSDPPPHSSSVTLQSFANNCAEDYNALHQSDNLDSLQPLPSNYSVTSSTESTTEIGEESYQNFYGNYVWIERFYLGDLISIKSTDEIFKNAEFSFKWDRDVDKDDRNIPVIKPFLPIIRRTVDNNYANKKIVNCNTADQSIMKPIADNIKPLHVEENSFQEEHYQNDKITDQVSVIDVVDPVSIYDKVPDQSSSPSDQISLTENLNTTAIKDIIPVINNDSAPISPIIATLTKENLASHTNGSKKSLKINNSKSLKFKIPILPPAKRPPGITKHQLVSKSKVGVNSKLRSTSRIEHETSAANENDDTLSLTASSITYADEKDEDNIFEGNQEEDIPLKEPEILAENEQQQYIPHAFSHNFETPLFDNVVDFVAADHCQSTSSTSLKSVISFSNLEENINTWMAMADIDSRTAQLQETKVTSLPRVFKSVCHYHFGPNKCTRRICKQEHDVHKLGIRIKRLSCEELKKAYIYTKNKYKLFIGTFDYFLSAFEEFKCTEDLMHCVNDILHLDIYNKTPYIEKIIASLCNIGVPFIDAVEEIFSCGDSDKEVCLSDILLDIVCLQYKQHLYNNWCIVQNLLKHRLESLDRGLVEGIMTVCYQNKNIKLAINIVQDIIQSRLIDLQQINVHTLNNFLSILESHKTEEGCILRKEMENGDILTIPSFCDRIQMDFNQSHSANVSEHNDMEIMPQNVSEDNINHNIQLGVNERLPNRSANVWETSTNLENLFPENCLNNYPIVSPQDIVYGRIWKTGRSTKSSAQSQQSSKLEVNKSCTGSQTSENVTQRSPHRGFFSIFQNGTISRKSTSSKLDVNKTPLYDDLPWDTTSNRSGSQRFENDTQRSHHRDAFSSFQHDTVSRKSTNSSGISSSSKLEVNESPLYNDLPLDNTSNRSRKSFTESQRSVTQGSYHKDAFSSFQNGSISRKSTNSKLDANKSPFYELLQDITSNRSRKSCTESQRSVTQGSHYKDTSSSFQNGTISRKSTSSKLDVNKSPFYDDLLQDTTSNRSRKSCTGSQTSENITERSRHRDSSSNLQHHTLSSKSTKNSGKSPSSKLDVNNSPLYNDLSRDNTSNRSRKSCTGSQRSENVTQRSHHRYAFSSFQHDTVSRNSTKTSGKPRSSKLNVNKSPLCDDLSQATTCTGSQTLEIVTNGSHHGLPQDAALSERSVESSTKSQNPENDNQIIYDFNDIVFQRSKDGSTISQTSDNDLNQGSFHNFHPGLPQDVIPGKSVDNSTKSESSENEKKLDNLEAHPSNENEDVHNLNNNETLDDSDLVFLRNIIRQGNNLEYIMMLARFKNSPLRRAFVLNTLVYCKSQPSEVIYNLFYPITTDRGDVAVMNLVHMVIVNILGLLENLGEYKLASNILLQFKDDYHKLCNTTWFIEPHRYEYSASGKYIYFCKILVRGRHLHNAWAILSNPELKLLYGVNKWTLKHNDCFDMKLRNLVLKDLIQTALDNDLKFAEDVILSIINDNKIITEIDIWKFFNNLLLKMIDCIAYKKDLKNLLENIVDGWYKYLYPNVMRGLLVCLAVDIPERNSLQLYEKCCKLNCYPYIRGDERTLVITTHMIEVEIYMMLHVYMYKKAKNIFPLTNLTLLIRLPDPEHQQPQILSNSRCSILGTKLRIAKVLADGLTYPISINYSIVEEHQIIVQEQQLKRLLMYYQNL